MNKKDFKFLENKLLELVDNNIISNEQYLNAKNYYSNNKRNKKSIITILSAIGVFLMALSIITLFAINWDNISKGIKVIISFIPLLITSGMLYSCIIKENKKMELYTSIFAPISILATNSLIGQVFHIQTEIFELIYISLLMFLPIAFILRNYISIIVYGTGTIIFSFAAVESSFGENIQLVRTFILPLPLIIYNIKNYITNKNDHKNLIMWVVNVTLLTLLMALKEFFRPDSFIIYLYMIYFITQTVFNKENFLTQAIYLAFSGFLLISCITPSMVSYAEEIKFGFDTLVLTILTGIFFYLSSAYKNPKEYFVLIFIFLLQYTRMHEEILFIFVNIIAIAWGIYKIVLGNKQSYYKEIKEGIAIILLLIFFRFVNADFTFMQKSIMFLIAGASFIIGANVMKKRIGGEKDD